LLLVFHFLHFTSFPARLTFFNVDTQKTLLIGLTTVTAKGEKIMNGAEMLLRTAANAGIEVCFANAGTTELPLVAAFDAVSGIHPVLALFEGVCTGGADGYGRVKEKPAMTLLHLGPGFANGIANLHNARRARTPLINIIGQHTTWHIDADAPLTMDVNSLSKTVSAWTRTSTSAENLSGDLAEAYTASMSGKIATLIVPNDHLWGEIKGIMRTPAPLRFDPLDLSTIESAAGLLRAGKKTALMLGGKALRGHGLSMAGHIQSITGCDLLTETFPGYVERGAGLPDVIRIPYFPEPALALLSRYEAIILVDVKEPVTFFGYPGIESYLLTKDQKKLTISSGTQNIVEVLGCLEDILKTTMPAKNKRRNSAKPVKPQPPRGILTAEKACQVLAALQPEGAIIVDEGITSGIPYYPLTAVAPPHAVLAITGGSIGYGMPCAVGAALAYPDRPVINFQADGSAMYTIQALWTEAREGLNVKTLICSNRGYNILRVELERAGITNPGLQALSLADIDQPKLDWVSISSGMGVPAKSVNTAGSLKKELEKILSEPGPSLIEMVL
jgi:acetolactate synthase I/II/III large subunit